MHSGDSNPKFLNNLDISLQRGSSLFELRVYNAADAARVQPPHPDDFLGSARIDVRAALDAPGGCVSLQLRNSENAQKDGICQHFGLLPCRSLVPAMAHSLLMQVLL